VSVASSARALLPAAPAGPGVLLEEYRQYCDVLDRGDDARGLRIRLACRFLAAHGDLGAWMTRPVEARLADLQRIKAWPLISYAVAAGRLRLDADLLFARRLGGLGRSAWKTAAVRSTARPCSAPWTMPTRASSAC
jgi:hypothetical protein